MWNLAVPHLAGAVTVMTTANVLDAQTIVIVSMYNCKWLIYYNKILQLCMSQKLVKYGYFYPSLPNWTHLCHLCLASLPSLLFLPIFAYLCLLDLPGATYFVWVSPVSTLADWLHKGCYCKNVKSTVTTVTGVISGEVSCKCMTKSGPVPDAMCVFPFKYGGITYNDCSAPCRSTIALCSLNKARRF